MIEALVPIGASLISGLFGHSGAKSQNRTQIQLAREQMDFQERMSSSAYQRATEDMKSAGLNPMLAYSQGGASAPMGAMPQVQNTAAAAVSSATQGAQAAQTIQQILATRASTEQMEAQTEKIRSETMEKQLNTAALVQQIRGRGARSDLDEQEHDYRHTTGYGGNKLRQEQTRAEIEKLHLANRLNASAFQADVDRRKAESEIARFGVPKAQAEAEFYKGLGEYSPYIRQLLDMARNVLGIGIDLKNIRRK